MSDRKKRGGIGWWLRRAGILMAMLFLLRWEYPPPGDPTYQLAYLTAGREFNFVSWELGALLGKAGQALSPLHRYLPPQSRRQIVLDYLDLVQAIHRTEDEINRLYADPQVADPEAASASLRVRLARLRAQQAREQLLVEAILEEQVATVLADEGFAFLGEIVPPVSFHFTPLPRMLVISPRDEIRQMEAVPLQAGFPVDQAAALEAQVDERLNVSSLVVPIGGLALYPAMTLESTSLPWLAETIAHEWTHHYLFLRPLGWQYESNPEARTINETAANLVGKAIGRKVLERYYPEQVPPPPPPSPPESPSSAEPPAFHFTLEMRKTRIHVDELLAEARRLREAGDDAGAEAKIEEAEAYMEARRRLFVEHGYRIRKLNQAYFAFYGAYADEPLGGAAGANPVGSAVQALWKRSPSIKAFLDTVAFATSLEDLKRVLGEE